MGIVPIVNFEMNFDTNDGIASIFFVSRIVTTKNRRQSYLNIVFPISGTFFLDEHKFFDFDCADVT
jgi:hypothetical protein